MVNQTEGTRHVVNTANYSCRIPNDQRVRRHVDLHHACAVRRIDDEPGAVGFQRVDREIYVRNLGGPR